MEPTAPAKQRWETFFKLRDLKSDEVQKMTDSELFDIIAKGKGKMPAQEGKLKPEEIANVIAYVRSMGSPAAEKSK